jgi:phage recombination protein Bet
MSNIAKHESAAVANVVEEKTLLEYLDTMGLAKTAPDSVKKMFLQVCKAFQLNPFKRQAYLVGYGQEHKNWSVITGFEQYINRANATERLDGWKVDIEGKVADNSLRAKITIWRKDFSHPFEWESWYYECVATDRNGNPTHIWKQRPTHMIKKVAIAQGFRLCFPEALEGMPYTGDEMGETIDIQYQEERPKKEAAPAPKQEAQKEEAGASVSQKTELLLLLNNKFIDAKEKADMLENINGISAARIEKAIAKIKQTIEERKQSVSQKPEPEVEDAEVMEDAQEQEEAPANPITKSQLEVLKPLLSSPHLTKEEKERVESKMETFTKEDAEKTINTLLKWVKERKQNKQAA